MAEKYIKLNGKLIPVTDEVYIAYYRQDRRARFSHEKHQMQGVVSFQELDTEEMTGEDMIPDLDATSVEEQVAERLLHEHLRYCLSLLTDEEQKLIFALYYEEMTEREYAKTIGISQVAVHKRKHRALEKLREMIKK